MSTRTYDFIKAHFPMYDGPKEDEPIMEVHAFTVYDSCAQRYLEVFFCPTVEFAIREFARMVNDNGSQFAKYPSDYTLFYIGTFHPETGKLVGKDPTSLGVAVTFLAPDLPIGEEF